MLHIVGTHQKSKRKAEVGDTIFVIPIRYYEPNDYEPEKLTIKQVDENWFYGYHEEYGHDVYLSIDSDVTWFYSFEAAKEAQLLLAQLKEIIEKDEIKFLTRRYGVGNAQ